MRGADLLRDRGKHAEAVRVYDQWLRDHPFDPIAWNHKGMCLRALGDPAGAMQCFEQALLHDSGCWSALNNKGALLRDEALLPEAVEAFSVAVALTLDPAPRENLAATLTDLGTRLKRVGKSLEAISKYEEALEVKADFAPAWFNLGFALAEENRMEEAVKSYLKALEARPDYLEALCNLGVIYKDSGRLDEAIACYERARACSPNCEIVNANLAIAYTEKGTLLKQLGRCEEGIAMYKMALGFNARYSHAWYNLGVAHADQLRIDEAVLAYEVALTINPQFAEACNNLGVLAKEMGNLERSIRYYEMALAINPRFAETLNNLGVIYTLMGRTNEGLQYCKLAIEANPNYAEAYNNLGVLFRDEGRIPEAIASYAHCIALKKEAVNAAQNRLLALNYAVDFSPVQIYEEHFKWGREFSERFTRFPLKPHSNRRIRIGYVSPDLCIHSVSYFCEAPIRFHDSSKFEVFCYFNLSREDERTRMFKDLVSLDHWRDIVALSTEQVCEIIAGDEIDILVDLTGHTAGNRLDVFAMKPAPVQVTWIGYPNTTGLPTIDYRIGDAIADAGECDDRFVEKLVRLPGCFLCYSPPRVYSDVAPLPSLGTGVVTFGSFNNLAKISEDVIALWCKILSRVPESRMLMKCKPFATDRVRDRFFELFAKFGIPSHRVDLIPLAPKTEDHLALYGHVDIALDSFPYAGTTTTCEALLMGVPVITLKGEAHAQNVGMSLIKSISLAKLEMYCLCETREQYVENAVSLATCLEDLEEIRKSLRPQMLASSLCDGLTFTKHVESAFLSMLGRPASDREEL